MPRQWTGGGVRLASRRFSAHECSSLLNEVILPRHLCAMSCALLLPPVAIRTDSRFTPTRTAERGDDFLDFSLIAGHGRNRRFDQYIGLWYMASCGESASSEVAEQPKHSLILFRAKARRPPGFIRQLGRSWPTFRGWSSAPGWSSPTKPTPFQPPSAGKVWP